MKSGLRELIFVALLMSLPAGMYLKVFKPRAGAEKQMQQDINEKKKIISEIASKRVIAMGNLSEDIKSLKKVADDANKRLPSEPNADAVMGMISRLAKDNDLVIEKIQALKSQPSKAGHAVPHMAQRINVELEGDFKGIYSLLIDIERSDRLIAVKQLKLDRMFGGKQGRVSARLDFEIYYKPEAEVASAGGAL